MTRLLKFKYDVAGDGIEKFGVAVFYAPTAEEADEYAAEWAKKFGYTVQHHREEERDERLQDDA